MRRRSNPTAAPSRPIAFWCCTKEVEKTLLDQLGLHYLHAHQIATRAEQAAVPGAIRKVKADDATYRHEAPGRGAKRLPEKA
jgi:hypothetical protein